jgi:hypothetical protein
LHPGGGQSPRKLGIPSPNQALTASHKNYSAFAASQAEDVYQPSPWQDAIMPVERGLFVTVSAGFTPYRYTRDLTAPFMTADEFNRYPVNRHERRLDQSRPSNFGLPPRQRR